MTLAPPNRLADPSMDRVIVRDEALTSIAVLMLTMDQRENTLRALDSLEWPDGIQVEVFLWDNGSTDGTCDAVRRRFPSVHVHWSPVNLGVAGGRNAVAEVAIERFDPEFLCFLDNDLVLTPGFLAALAAELGANPETGQVQAKLRYLDRPEILNYGGGSDLSFWRGRTRPVGDGEEDRGQYDRVTPCVACGGAMMVRAELFQRLGGFDLAFNPFGPEDLDFSLRLQALGYRALYVPTAMAFHAESHSFEPRGYTERYAKLKAQHWLRFLRRHGTPLDQLGFFAVGMPLIVLRLAIREGRKGNLGALTGSVRGLFSALRSRRGPG
jgi:GT2 family glycosyltransferase